MEDETPAPVPAGVLVAATLGLFAVWSATFLAFEVLLVPGEGSPALGWFDLVAARFLPVAALAGGWCLLARRSESLEILRAHPVRLLLSALFCVPGYNGLLYLGMESRVEAPIASLLTSLVPLYLLVLGRLFLGEALTGRKFTGLALGLSGVGLIATAREGGGESRAIPVLVTALAPLAWAIHTALTRPVMGRRSPLLWTYLVLTAGGILLLPFLPFVDRSRVSALGAMEAWLLAYLIVPTTLVGFAVWSWLLRHLPAGTVGLTTFLNPPLTLGWKAALAALFPAAFTLAVAPREWVGGALAMAGVAVVVLGGRPQAAGGAGGPRDPGKEAESSGLPRPGG